MSWFHRKPRDVVHLQCIDAATGQVFSQSHMPVEKLPRSFEAQTTMHRPDGDWEVVSARPMTAEEALASGKLVLVLRKVETNFADSKDVLFSLATICDGPLPVIAEGSSKLNADVIELHEDDWRQIEWISAALRKTVEQELEAIRQIHETESEGPGFRKIHLRQAIPAPLGDRALRLDDLRDAIGEKAKRLDGISYAGTAGIAKNAFAVRLISSIELYGAVRDDEIQCLCTTGSRTNNAWYDDVTNLLVFAAERDLLLVDWLGATVIETTGDEYTRFFVRGDEE
jgi:hypothetical protein